MKGTVGDLALFGGDPEFDEVLHVGRPNLGDRDTLMRRIGDILDRNWLSNDGPFVKEFEERVAERIGVSHCVAMCNGTVALEIAARACDVEGEVIMPSFTFVATANAFQWQQVTPVFCDIERHTHNIDPARVEELITPRTSAIVGVHVWGRPCATAELQQIADRHGLTLMFDAAHAFGCGSPDGMVGQFGRAEVLSFHATKFLNSFEGGAVVTDDDELAERMRLMRNFGFAGYDDAIYIGVNGKMNEAAAAMGLTSLESIDDFIDHNRANHAAYRERLEAVPGVEMLTYDTEPSNYQYVVAHVVAEEAGVHRDTVVDALWAENVRARRYFYPGAHRMEPYRSYYPHAGLLLPVTEEVCDQVLVLPTGTAMDLDAVERVCDLVSFVVGNAAAIGDRLGMPD